MSASSNNDIMARLVNLQITDASNVICVWREDVTDGQPDDFRWGIACEGASGGFMVPRHIAVGTFDDGTVRAAGLQSLNDVNACGDDYDSLFMYGQFLYSVDVLSAKAFVRLAVDDGGYRDEEAAKAGVYKELLASGVAITDDAEAYLVRMTEEMCLDRIRALGTPVNDDAYTGKVRQLVNRWAADNARFGVGDIVTDGKYIIRVEKLKGYYSAGPNYHILCVEYTGQQLTRKLQPYKRGDEATLADKRSRPLHSI